MLARIGKMLPLSYRGCVPLRAEQKQVRRDLTTIVYPTISRVDANEKPRSYEIR